MFPYIWRPNSESVSNICITRLRGLSGGLIVKVSVTFALRGSSGCLIVKCFSNICITWFICWHLPAIININKNNSSMKQMPTNAWFDSECNELRKTINTYAKQSNLTHTENNNYYHNLCMIQSKKRNYNTNLKVNLEEMCSNNPKDYWGFWKRLQRQNLSESTIELYQFYNCFLKQSEPPSGLNTNTKFKTI